MRVHFDAWCLTQSGFVSRRRFSGMQLGLAPSRRLSWPTWLCCHLDQLLGMGKIVGMIGMSIVATIMFGTRTWRNALALSPRWILLNIDVISTETLGELLIGTCYFLGKFASMNVCQHKQIFFRWGCGAFFGLLLRSALQNMGFLRCFWSFGCLHFWFLASLCIVLKSRYMKWNYFHTKQVDVISLWDANYPNQHRKRSAKAFLYLLEFPLS